MPVLTGLTDNVATPEQRLQIPTSRCKELESESLEPFEPSKGELDITPIPHEVSVGVLLAQMTGHVAERVALKILREAGYEAEYTSTLLFDLKLQLQQPDPFTAKMMRDREQASQEGISPLLVKLKKEKTFKRFSKWLLTFDRAKGVNGMDRGTVPDLIARKGGKTYVIEVKSGEARVTTNQRKALIASRQFGMIPCIMRVDLRFLLEGVTIKELG